MLFPGDSITKRADKESFSVSLKFDEKHNAIKCGFTDFDFSPLSSDPRKANMSTG
jgi:hypothetical protein